MRFVLLSLLCLPAFAAGPALAQGADESSSAPLPVRIETDHAVGAFVFIVDDQPVAVLDKSGLTVSGDIAYGGTITDLGSEGVTDRLNASTETEAAND
ncbi:hypothetical protein AUC70_05810 [Methyloceanibacter stevinii]|uniref:Uncharacterized protein n=1 Tax=Methyloceanibacter stevinii TaxID=1774970 RepID=A0A1E3VNV1_9HYPH|nr:hypothetical protein [Methyloceanibacter stevinii]ODR95213.1 hypothetical protein AUC70_05810 [Methyloceanibacter stevinii]